MKKIVSPLVVISSIYSIVLLIFYITNFDEFRGMNPNEWGDFLAGSFAPLAFMWLVFGYKRQGDELKQNTEMLKLQANELSNSVEQQKELVNVSNRELQLLQEREIRQLRLETLQAQPFFHFNNMELTSIEGNPDGSGLELILFSFILKNSRGICREMTIASLSEDKKIKIVQNFNLLTSENSHEIEVEFHLPYKYEYENNDFFRVNLKIEYLDSYDVPQFQIIELLATRDFHHEHWIYQQSETKIIKFDLYTKRREQSF